MRKGEGERALSEGEWEGGMLNSGSHLICTHRHTNKFNASKYSDIP